MNMMIKMMNSDFEAPNNQSKEAFEIELVSNFLQETTFQQYHHCRALAMKADVLRRTGRYEEAIASIVQSTSSFKNYIRRICIRPLR